MIKKKIKIKSMYFQLGLAITVFVVLIEFILLVFSLSSKEADLVKIKKEFNQFYSQSTDSKVSISEPLSTEDISARLSTFTRNVILLTLIIIISVVAGTLIVFHFIMGKNINYVTELNELTDSTKKMFYYDNRKIACLEIQEILISRDKMLRRIEEDSNQITSLSNLSAIGEMAGNIAHEINNPLTIISSTAHLLKIMNERGDLTPEIQEKKLNTIQDTTIRVSKIVESLRVLSRDSSNDELERIPISIILNEITSVSIERMRVNNIMFSYPNTEEIDNLVVECKHVQVAQVFINLVNNSYDAIIHNEAEKWIKIEIEKMDNFIEISVSDSGSGIPPEVVDKMFRPYFTTKDIGEGTGLGLSLSKKMIEQSGGSLWYDKKSQNTCFKFKLSRVKNLT